MKSDRINYRHEQERSYSARSYDHVFELLVTDPHGLVKKAFKSNSLTKWQRPEHLDEIKQEFALMLHKRYAQKRDDLVELFNGSFFNYFLVRYLRNQLMSSTSPFADRWQRFSGIEIKEDHARVSMEVDHDDVRSLNATDQDVIYWLLRTKTFTEVFTRDQLALYRRYLDKTTVQQKRITVKAFASMENLDYKPTVAVISQITRKLRERVKHLNAL